MDSNGYVDMWKERKKVQSWETCCIVTRKGVGAGKWRRFVCETETCELHRVRRDA